MANDSEWLEWFQNRVPGYSVMFEDINPQVMVGAWNGNGVHSTNLLNVDYGLVQCGASLLSNEKNRFGDVSHRMP